MNETANITNADVKALTVTSNWTQRTASMTGVAQRTARRTVRAGHEQGEELAKARNKHPERWNEYVFCTVLRSCLEIRAQPVNTRSRENLRELPEVAERRGALRRGSTEGLNDRAARKLAGFWFRPYLGGDRQRACVSIGDD